VRRVSVVGLPGSGKTTLARKLAARLSVPHIELDAIYHQPGWAGLPAPEFRSRVAALAAGQAWVIDGNYSAVQPLVWQHADTVIWLDPPRRRVMARIIWRTIRRVMLREELWNHNRERLANLLSWDPEQSVISWAWHHYPVYRQRYAAAAADPQFAHLTFIRISSQAEVGRLVGLGHQQPPPTQ
jgi:adenylate kinase family enzyme